MYFQKTKNLNILKYLLVNKIKSILAIIDTSINSASSFFISYLLINFSSSNDYAYYAYFTAAMLLVLGVQNAMICTPISILGAKKTSDISRSGYISSLLLFQSAVCVFFLLIYLIASYLYDLKKWDLAVYLCFIWLSREFFRSVGYMLKNSPYVLKGDIVYATSLVILVLLLIIKSKSSLNIDVYQMIFILMISMFFSCIYFILTGRSHYSIQSAQLTNDVKQTWIGSKWALLGVGVTWVQNNTYIYLVGSIIDMETTAALAATRLLMTPISILSNGLFVVSKPKWAEESKLFKSTVLMQVNRLIYLLVLILLIYSIFIIMNWDLITSFLFGGNYSNRLSLFILWSLYFFVLIIRSRYSSILQIIEEFKKLTIYSMPLAFLSFISAIVLISLLGAAGGLLSMILCEIAFIVVLHKYGAIYG